MTVLSFANRAVWACRELPDRLALAARARGEAARTRLMPCIRFHPPLTNEADFLDVYWKTMHYLPPGTVGRIDIPVDFKPSFPLGDPSRYPQPEYMAPVVAGIRRDVRVLRSRGGALSAALLAADLVYVWDWSSVREGGTAAESPRVRNVDRTRSVNEAWTWCEYLHERQPESARAAARAESLQRLQAFLGMHPRLQRAYVFGTGPSLEQAWTRDWSDGYRIVCNTIVDNERLLAHLKPHFIVAGDAAYHFGISHHASTFRRNLERALSQHPAWFLTRDLYGPLMRMHHPNVRERMLLAECIELGSDWTGPDRLCFLPTGNVVTSLMLPLASQLAREVHFLGVDGRAPGDRGFWSYAPSNTSASLISSIQAAHPAFFKKDDAAFRAYAQHHSDHAEQLMTAGEGRGLRYRCLCRSYLPAFQRRQSMP